MSRDFGGRPWGLVHHVCLRSAVRHLKPERVNLYCQYEPRGPWWAQSRKLASVVRVRAPRTIYGNPVLHYAHRADVVRLEQLIEHGGIYLDADVLVHRDFEDLLQHSAVLGMEGREIDRGLCNAVILAEPNAPFLRRWHAEYKSFRSKGPDEFWVEHSVQIPSRLSRQFPNEVHVLPQGAFFWPSWDPEGLRLMFEPAAPLLQSGAYATHLWENLSWERYLKDLLPGAVRSLDTNFHRWARPHLAALPDAYGAPSSARRARRRLRAAVARRLPTALRDRLKRILAP